MIQIEISQDEEGNGGGFIFGLDLPEINNWYDPRWVAIHNQTYCYPW